jgi:hypothetical protein
MRTSNADRVLSITIERQGNMPAMLAQKSVQLSPGFLHVGLKLRFQTGPSDEKVQLSLSMKAEAHEELMLRHVTLSQVDRVEIVNPHAACKYERVEQQMLLEEERDKHERAKQREQQRKRQSLLDHRGALDSQSRLGNSTFNSSTSFSY